MICASSDSLAQKPLAIQNLAMRQGLKQPQGHWVKALQMQLAWPSQNVILMHALAMS